MTGMRKNTCADCGKVFEVPALRGALPQRCDPCREARKRQTDRAKSARWRDDNRESARDQWNRYNRKRLADPAHRQWKRDNELRRVYGLTRAELDAMLAKQNNRCGICGGERNGKGTRLHIDHCHDTGTIRGLLCSKCNTAIGLLDHDPARLRAAVKYLTK